MQILIGTRLETYLKEFWILVACLIIFKRNKIPGIIHYHIQYDETKKYMEDVLYYINNDKSVTGQFRTTEFAQNCISIKAWDEGKPSDIKRVYQVALDGHGKI
jgi:hypothetical protein